jgi:hypothetical protein
MPIRFTVDAFPDRDFAGKIHGHLNRRFSKTW